MERISKELDGAVNEHLQHLQRKLVEGRLVARLQVKVAISLPTFIQRNQTTQTNIIRKCFITTLT